MLYVVMCLIKSLFDSVAIDDLFGLMCIVELFAKKKNRQGFA